MGDDRGRHGSGGHARGRMMPVVAVVVVIAAMVAGAVMSGAWFHAHPTTITRTVVRTRTVAATTAADSSDATALAVELHRQRPQLSAVAIAAIVGNAWGESKASPKALERTDDGSAAAAKKSGSDADVRAFAVAGHGIGVMQWTGDRAVALMDSAKSRGLPWTDLGTQVDFLFSEMESDSDWRTPTNDSGDVSADGTQGRQSFESAAGVRAATDAMELGFVRPADPKASRDARLDAAYAIYEYVETRMNVD